MLGERFFFGGNMQTLSINFFEQFTVVIFTFAIVAIIVERSLYQVFDTKIYKWLEKKIDAMIGMDVLDLKPWLSFGLCWLIAYNLNLDMLAAMFAKTSSHFTIFITGLFLSGGSTGVYKFLKRVRTMRKATLDTKISDINNGGK